MTAKTLDTQLIELAYRSRIIRPIWRAYRQWRATETSAYDNIYHCCTQKTASQWFRSIFADPIFTNHTGLEPYPFVSLGLRTAQLTQPLPGRTVVVHLYVDFPTFAALPKPERYRVFFVLRDPRDAVVSWYYSARFSHASIPPMPEMRLVLQGLDQRDGLKFIIDKFEEFGFFAAQRSWMGASSEAAIFRYEDLAADNRVFLSRLLAYLGLRLSTNESDMLLRRHSFARLAGGRHQGEEAVMSHYRKGVAGDWRNHFDAEINAYFYRVTGDLLEILGYA